jgi:hypothetical protein
MAVGEDAVEVAEQELGDLAEGRQPLPPERPQPRREEAARSPFVGVVSEMRECSLSR